MKEYITQNKKEDNLKPKKTDIIELKVNKVEDKSIIVSVDGWRMRVYKNIKDVKEGQNVLVEYEGNIEDIHSVRLIGVIK